MYYIPKHFKIHELVDPETFSALGERGWILFRPELLWTLDMIREFFKKPVMVNNWKSGGSLKFRGFRPSSCKVGVKYSQHRLGNGVDLDVAGMTSDEVRESIVDNFGKYEGFSKITAMERRVTWVHLDLRNIDNSKGITFFDP